MIKFLRTDSSNQDFVDLVKELDADLKIRDGEDHSFYDQFNKIDKIKYAVVAYENQLPISCGAIKEFDDSSFEVKRMYTKLNARGKGIAVVVLKELEKWAAELGYAKCILETGRMQPEAIRLYEKSGYTLTQNYGQYADVENSLCFQKVLH
ncbi:MAG: GNAT family N-acetyltransferase [Reichenbachiella sp.]